MGKTDKVAYQFLKGENKRLTTRIAELERELAEARRDSERLDKLDVLATRSPVADPKTGAARWMFFLSLKSTGGGFRAAIDDAQGDPL